MARTIGCPTCPTRLKVPDDADGRRVKCPRCGGVMTVPASGGEPAHAARVPDASPAEPVRTPPPSAPAPARARRLDDSDERPVPTARRADPDDRPPRRQRDDRPREDTRPDAPVGPPLHKGWKSVALGYRLLGLAMLFLALGVLLTAGAAFGSAYMAGGGRKADDAFVLAASGVGGFFGFLVGLFTLLGHGFLMGMPKDEDGGKGKTLAVVMFVLLFLPGLNLLAPLILLPIFSGGIGTALDKPKLRKYGFGLFLWYAVGFVLLPLLAGGAYFGVVAGTGDKVVAGIVAVAITLILGLLVFFSVWGTFAGMRRGIQASVRDRGVTDGDDPRPKKEPRRVDDDVDDAPPPRRKLTLSGRDEDDRPKAKARDDDSDDRPAKPRQPREDDSDHDSEDRPRERR